MYIYIVLEIYISIIYERKANYYGPIVTGGNRDLYDEKAEELQKTLYNRHTSQLSEAQQAEGVDAEWIEDKNRVIELNQDIRVKRKNFDTYKNAIEIEKTLYNSNLYDPSKYFMHTNCKIVFC